MKISRLLAWLLGFWDPTLRDHRAFPKLSLNENLQFIIVLSPNPPYFRFEPWDLSTEILRLVKRYLKEGGPVYNTPAPSMCVPFTAAQEFRYITPVANFVAASDSPFAMTREQKREALMRFKHNGTQVFSGKNPGSGEVLNRLVDMELPEEGESYRARKDRLRITDDNMATEFKNPELRPKPLFHPEWTWAHLLKVLAKN